VISTPRTPRLVRDSRAVLGQHLTDWGYAAGWRMVRTMPDLWARKTFDAGAFYAALGGGPHQLRKNLARVTGVAPKAVPDSLMRASLASYARYWREAFRLPSMDYAALHRSIDGSMVGKERVAAALHEGRGAVMALPHSGNWDVAGVWMAQEHGTFTTVAERLKPESLYRRFITYRESLGFEVLPLSGGERPAYEVLVERLRANRLVCLMADRDLTRSGVQVDFFGEPTRMPAGPARLAIETGAALLPTYSWFENNGWGLVFHPPLDTTSGDVNAIIQALADRFAAGIADHPEDWHMLQPQWLADLPDERRARLQVENS
jgi:phosphatidylinositol dimannoside acyltransferase